MPELCDLPDRSDLASRADYVAAVAAETAEATDRDAAFPTAAIDAARRSGLLALLVPRSHGGEGAPLGAVAQVCYTLGQSCASTAMIVAMHQAALACVVRHAGASHWHNTFLRRVADEGLLLASSTTEGTGGGNVRLSEAALVVSDGALQFDRAATVMSYGAEADAIVSTARRTEQSIASDQALVVLLKPDYALAPTGAWNTLGMRGTSSGGFALAAKGSPDQVLPTGYDKIHPQTMVPVSHIVWAAVWTGIAAAAVAKAQLFLRTVARKNGGRMPPGAPHATQASATLRVLRASVAARVAAFERDACDEAALGSMETQSALNLFKVEASEHALAAVGSALRACGLAGYRDDGPFSIGRHLRDILSAPLMIHNDRILANIANASLLSGVPTSLFD